MGRRKKLPRLENIKIEGIAADGKCFTKEEGIVIFIDGRTVAPDDIVDLQIIKKRKNFWEGRVEKIHQLSAQRTTPFCQHFGICGGCKWQHIPYKIQLQTKAQQVYDNLRKIGKVELPELRKIIPSAKTQYYRNKLEFTFSERRWFTEEEIKNQGELAPQGLGFHIPKHFNKVIDIEACHLQREPVNQVRLLVKKLALESGLSFFNFQKQSGFWRNLVIRTSNTNEVMVILIVTENNEKIIHQTLKKLQEEIPELSSLHYIINAKKNDSYQDLEVNHFAGTEFLTEEVEDLKFRVGAKSFYQTNPEQAYQLYKTVREFADLQGDELVYDLYTGTGTIANFIANKAKKVMGLEYVESAIEDAKINATINQIDNTEFFAGDMKYLLKEGFVNEKGKPDVIITDPPRAGMHQDVIEMLLKIAPEKIIYVSCNPATQARDIALLDTQYKITAGQPVDMFPHTQHVENVLKLERR